MHRLALLLLTCTLAFAAEKVRILRDEFGVPHIFTSTAEGAAYGSGHAQAEDRLEEPLRNYRKAEGTMSEVFGENWFRHDYRQRLWRQRRVAEERYKELDANTRGTIEAFQAGVKRFMGEHPDQAWAPKIEPGRAEKLFSQARAKPTDFIRREELEKHVSSVKELTY